VSVLGIICRFFLPVSDLNIGPKCIDIILTVFSDFDVFLSDIFSKVFQLLCKLCFLPIPLFDSLNQRPVHPFCNKFLEKLLSPLNFMIYLVGLMMDVSDLVDSLSL